MSEGLQFVVQFAIVIAAIVMGIRAKGIGLGLWGGVGLLVLVFIFGAAPASPPINVIFIILAVIMAASVMDAAGGIQWMVHIATQIIQRNPSHITIVAPPASLVRTSVMARPKCIP